MDFTSNLIKRFFLIILIVIPFLNADESKLALGIGSGFLTYPDYIGSKSYSTLPFAFPYIKYSSKNFSIDRNGISQKLFDIKNLILDLSFSGSLPANSEDNDARKDMPNLNFTFEVGPKLTYNFYDKKNLTIGLELAIRSVMDTDFEMLEFQGIVGATEVKFKLDIDELGLTFSSGARFGNEKYHNYFYGVTKEYETQTRRVYASKAGYSGYKNKLGARYRSGDWWYGAVISHHTLRGASYKDSPLLETEDAFYLGCSFAYIFYTQTWR